ncbi:phage tail spike protein [Lysinibacillus sp. NPDC058147]|uniref:phage tail spike protein n=1 Tax=unclassified Lysinibacillus TaxID=2636778 RepID=UPI0036D7AFF5
MLIVTNYAGTRTEPFFTTSAPLFEQDTLGNTTLEFTVNKTNNESGFNLLQEETIVTAANYDFRVKQIIDDKPGRKTILAISTFFDLAYQFKDKTYGGTHSSQEFVNYLFASTGWTVTCDFTETATIDKFGSKNIIQCVNQICNAFDCEFEILPNKRVHFSKSLGPDNGAQYRYGYNIKTLSRKIDTTHLRTKVTATGKEDLTVTYTSPNHTIWGIRVADPISDERFTNPDNLLKKAKDSLIDYPEVNIELDTLELLDKALGEKVWLIYEPIEGLELQTRILKRICVVDELTDELKTIEVTLGNSLPRSMSDSELDSEEELADTKEELEEVIDESKKEFRSAITQTDSRITIEVEQLNKSIAMIDVKADNISLSVNNRITNEVASINIRADQIQSTVSSQGAQLHGLDTKVANAESTITQQAWQISQKVSITDYDGNTIVSKINQDAWSYTIDAQRINLNGAVMVNGSISGSTDINVSRDVSIGRNLTFQGSGQNIIRFADMSYISSDGYGGLAIDLWSDLDIQASKTKFWGNVDFSNANVIGLDNGGGISFFQSTNSPKTLVVRKNGSDIGYLTMN